MPTVSRGRLRPAGAMSSRDTMTDQQATRMAAEATQVWEILDRCVRAGRDGLRCGQVHPSDSPDEVLFTIDGAPSMPTIAIHLPGFTGPRYASGHQLSVSYRGDLLLADKPILDRICGALFATEVELAALLPGLVVEPEAPRPAETPPADEGPVEIDSSRWPMLAAALGRRTGTTVRLFESGGNAFLIEAHLNGQTERLIVAPRTRWRSPYLAGDQLAVSIAGALPADRAARGNLLEVAHLLVAHEAELLRADFQRRALETVIDSADGSEPVVFPVGKLTALRSFAPPSDRPFVGEDVGMLFLTSPCFANCTFCGEETTRNATFSDPQDVEATIRQRPRELTRVLICGYEPLSHPGVLGMVAACRETGATAVQLVTTGIPLGDVHLVRALVAAGVTSVAVPLYSHQAVTNDLIMRRHGAFDATIRGLDALAAAGVTIHMHSLVLTANLHDIDEIATLAAARWQASFVASAVRDKGSYEEVAPNFEDIAAAVYHAPVFAVPFCFMPRMVRHPDVDRRRPLQYSIKAIADVMRVYLSAGLVHTEDCARCAYRLSCKGAAPAQLARRPELRLKPIIEGA